MTIIRKKYQILMIELFVAIAIAIGIAILIAITSWSVDLKLSLVLVLLIILLIILMWFKPRLFYYSQQFAFIRLKNCQNPPIATKYDLSIGLWIAYLIKLKFIIFSDSDAFTMVYRIVKNTHQTIIHRSMLEILVVIKQPTMTYTDANITKTINRLEDDCAKRKQSYRNYSILLIKTGPVLTEAEKNLTDQVVFERQVGYNIVTINGFFNTETQKLYFLHSDKFYPTIYYKYAVDLLLSLI
ncbi:MAG: hypothetical protein WC479_03315 [Candidatus Izemoplasmatales bacterium]|jgi:hypothetical protein